MLQPSFKSVIEDSYRNKYYLYYSGANLCCKEVSRDGITRDTIIASQVSDNFLAAIDLHDRMYAVCHNREKGVCIFQFTNGAWKLDQILSIQGSGNITLLSLFAVNGALHIIYAKQMAIANFYNICHLFKPINPSSFHVNTTWRRYNVCEMYAENLSTSYSAIVSKEGSVHLVCEWFDGNSFLINYYYIDSAEDAWKKKTVATLFKKDIILNLLYDDNILHLLCYTYDDEASAIFYYIKKEGSGKDFEFFCLDKINTESSITPYFHMEGSVIYVSWLSNKMFYQYSLGKEQKSWAKKITSVISGNEPIQLIEFIRNRKGRYWISKKTYFTIDYKYNINLPYFKENSTNEINSNGTSNEATSFKNADGDLVRYIPYLIDEVNSLSQVVKAISERLEELEAKKSITYEYKPSNDVIKSDIEPQSKTKEIIKLKRSNFKDQFLKSNTLLSRPEAAAIFMGPGSIPNPNELTKKEEIEIVENSASSAIDSQSKADDGEASAEAFAIKADIDNALNKDGNIFKKIGDFFK